MVNSILVGGIVLVVVILGSLAFFGLSPEVNMTDTTTTSTTMSTTTTTSTTTSTTSTTTTTQPTESFTIAADDNRFYIDNEDIDSIVVNSNSMENILFEGKEENVYFGGLRFEGCGKSTEDTDPGETASMQFETDQDCTITSYWPSSDQKKDDLSVNVE